MLLVLSECPQGCCRHLQGLWQSRAGSGQGRRREDQPDFAQSPQRWLAGQLPENGRLLESPAGRKGGLIETYAKNTVRPAGDLQSLAQPGIHSGAKQAREECELGQGLINTAEYTAGISASLFHCG